MPESEAENAVKVFIGTDVTSKGAGFGGVMVPQGDLATRRRDLVLVLAAIGEQVEAGGADEILGVTVEKLPVEPSAYLRTMGNAIHATAAVKGHWEHRYVSCVNPEIHGRQANPSIFEEKLMLIVSEVAEVLEARRDGDGGEEEAECADIIIRVLDYCAARGFDMDAAVALKMRTNENRERLHGRKR